MAKRKQRWQARAAPDERWLLNPAVGELADGLETPVQAVYLVTLLGFLVVGAYLVVRQVLIRRELEEAAKVLGDRTRSGSAASEVRISEEQPNPLQVQPAARAGRRRGSL